MPRLLTTSLLLLISATAFAGNWPQWRGPGGDGNSSETNLPAKWGPDTNIVWKLKMPGMGSSTPAIWGDHVFLTSEDGDDLVLLCVSTAGKELWKRKIASGRGARYMRGEGNDASASPSTDGRHVFALVGTGELGCFDFDGNEVWRFNLQQRYGKFRIMHGFHTTPLLHGDRLYLQLLHSNGHFVIALDKATGKEIWKVERPSDARRECEQAYASPVLWSNGKESYLVVHGNDYCTAHDLKDGHEIWRVGDLNPKSRYRGDLRFVASPVASPDLIVVPSAKNGPVVGVKPSARGNVELGGPFEQWRMSRGTPDVPSPLIHDGLVYLCGEQGYLTILDAKSGKPYVNHERIHSARYRASPVYADGKIFLTARDGAVTVIKPGKALEVLAENRLPDQMTASPVVSDGRIYLRGWDTLYAIGLAK